MTGISTNMMLIHSSQFPIVKRTAATNGDQSRGDGRTIKLADPAGEITEWQLHYSELSDDEAGQLQQFFLAAEGTLNRFTFLDPTANLLAWSGKLTNGLVEGSAADGERRSGGLAANECGRRSADDFAEHRGAGGYHLLLQRYVGARGSRVTVTMLARESDSGARVATADWRRITARRRRWTSRRSGWRYRPGCRSRCAECKWRRRRAHRRADERRRGGVYEGARFRDDALDDRRNGSEQAFLHGEHRPCNPSLN